MQFPNPGNGYTIREKLGAGNWKTAYRATSMHSARDVAILYFHDPASHSAFQGETMANLRLAREHRFKDYIAEFIGIMHDYGEPPRWYMVEELLARPLNKAGEINDILRFSRIARDLSRGLCCLHDNRLIHRDLKLDNCGLDHQDRAKIFDLGLVSSDPQDLRGNIFTRSPELFEQPGLLKKLISQRPSDVWALGATLFALRFGEYPFVHRTEVEHRELINQQAKNGEISQAKATDEKDKLRRQVASKIGASAAENKLKQRINEKLEGRAADILSLMLNFNENQRITAGAAAEQWDALCNELSGLNAHDVPFGDEWEEIRYSLELVKKGFISVSDQQLERLASDLKDNKGRGNAKSLGDIERAIRTIKQRRIKPARNRTEVSEGTARVKRAAQSAK